MIDPILANVELARKRRPRDMALCALVGSDKEAIEFWEYETYELSTSEENRVRQLAEENLSPSRKYLIESISLRSLGLGATPFDSIVLSIDVEG